MSASLVGSEMCIRDSVLLANKGYTVRNTFLDEAPGKCGRSTRSLPAARSDSADTAATGAGRRRVFLER
eukprot:5921304-Alexandrium_andersonii.AAC.1